MNTINWKKFLKDNSQLCIFLTVLFLLLIFISIMDNSNESISATIRNIGIVVIAPIGIVLAIWRSLVAEAQIQAMEKGQIQDRFQGAIHMLSDENSTIRGAGVSSLINIARQFPEIYKDEIFDILANLLRNGEKRSSKDLFKIRYVRDRDEEGGMRQRVFDFLLKNMESSDGFSKIRISNTHFDNVEIVEYLLDINKIFIEFDNVSFRRLRISGKLTGRLNFVECNIFDLDLRGEMNFDSHGIFEDCRIYQMSINKEFLVNYETRLPFVGCKFFSGSRVEWDDIKEIVENNDSDTKSIEDPNARMFYDLDD